MQFKQDTMGDVVESERQMILQGADCYGEYFINAMEFNNLLNNFIESVNDPSKFIAIAFIFQIRKYHSLALFSSVRRHHVQATMNMRYVIEAAQWAAFAMGNEEQEKFCRKDTNGIIYVDDRHEKTMYEWLDANFKLKADETRQLKKILSGGGSHSNIAYVFQNFEMKPFHDAGFKMSFFDSEDDYRIKTDLWFVANSAMGILDLFYGVNQQFQVFKLEEDFNIKFERLVEQNNRLKVEMMQTENFKKIEALRSSNL